MTSEDCTNLAKDIIKEKPNWFKKGNTTSPSNPKSAMPACWVGWIIINWVCQLWQTVLLPMDLEYSRELLEIVSLSFPQ